MEIEVKTEDDEGNITFQGTLKKNAVNFVLGVGINYLLAQGAMPFIKDMDDPEDGDTMIGPSTDTQQ
jgi:hypothetical protein